MSPFNEGSWSKQKDRCWTAVEQTLFEQTKSMVAKEAIPDFSKPYRNLPDPIVHNQTMSNLARPYQALPDP